LTDCTNRFPIHGMIHVIAFRYSITLRRAP
jgi:hypothetical protein